MIDTNMSRFACRPLRATLRGGFTDVELVVSAVYPSVSPQLLMTAGALADSSLGGGRMLTSGCRSSHSPLFSAVCGTAPLATLNGARACRRSARAPAGRPSGRRRKRIRTSRTRRGLRDLGHRRGMAPASRVHPRRHRRYVPIWDGDGPFYISIAARAPRLIVARLTSVAEISQNPTASGLGNIGGDSSCLATVFKRRVGFDRCQ